MSSAKTYTNHEIDLIMKYNGYICIRQTGSHAQHYRESDGDKISLRFKDNNKMMFGREAKKHGLNLNYKKSKAKERAERKAAMDKVPEFFN